MAARVACTFPAAAPRLALCAQAGRLGDARDGAGSPSVAARQTSATPIVSGPHEWSSTQAARLGCFGRVSDPGSSDGFCRPLGCHHRHHPGHVGIHGRHAGRGCFQGARRPQGGCRCRRCSGGGAHAQRGVLTSRRRRPSSSGLRCSAGTPQLSESGGDCCGPGGGKSRLHRALEPLFEAFGAVHNGMKSNLVTEGFPQIPWGGALVLQVLWSWMIGFLVVGAYAMGLVPHFLGVESSKLSACGHALGYLLCDMCNLLITLLVLTVIPRDNAFWNARLFSWKLNGSVVRVVLSTCAFFPFVDALSGVCLGAQDQLVSAQMDNLGTHFQRSCTGGDTAAMLLYFFVVAVCTPFWEELMFRGFLLSSLTKYLPSYGAVAVSSLVFTAAHFNLQKVPYLMFLSCLIGHTFVRTRTMLAPILVHGMWNFHVFMKVAVYPFMPALLLPGPV